MELCQLITKLAPASKAEMKAAVDAGAWMFNAVTSVGIIIVNKALMATYGFTFATTLTGLHFLATTLMTVGLRWLGVIQPSHLPFLELLKFILFANFSIVGMNVSLMWNSVGFYQISKLSIIPVLCLFEMVFDNIRYSRDTKLSIGVVLIGVGVCTVTDVSVNTKGFVAATIAVWKTALQQHITYWSHAVSVATCCKNNAESWEYLVGGSTALSYMKVHYLQKKYNLSSFNLLSHTAPAQAESLLLLGPFVDYWLTNNRINEFHFTTPAVVLIILSCVIAIGTNLSQFICIGRFTAVSFQVLGHMKTILVLVLGFVFFGKEGLNIQVVVGMTIAVLGMMWYGNASSKPGGKERRSPSIPKQQSFEQDSTGDEKV